MKKQGVKKSMIMSVISMVILFSIYWTNGATSIWHISVITVIGMLLYGVNKRSYQQAEVSLSNGTTYRRLKSFKIKKRYFLWIVSVTILIESIITISILKLNYQTENQERINQSLKDIPITEAIYRMGILSPIVEEIIFRGLLYMVCSGIVILVFNRFFKKAVRKHIDKTTGIIFVVISSVGFGVLHVIRAGDFENIAPYAIAGFVLSVLYVITKTIYVPILLHMIVNIISTFGSSYRVGIIDTNIAYSIVVFILLYSVIGFCVWILRHNKSITDFTEQVEADCKVLDLNRSAATKRQFIGFFRYVKGQMTVK
ncbi:CPBP family intramembrane metalloprotease [Mammaliicoccus sciuri]|uniref:CPBP family intramembrane glutamic endopeptidase n=1 Tax=Mammaliicoccus sciuri TaxID=1296 RepID=UPI001E52211F|nr:type II CAAX endopeptidase family protein [Mammaliicoccus sciuri]MCD8875463.1 CPBP family intramembrane metalloprotease [Mammaliicoccus sciuri]